MKSNKDKILVEGTRKKNMDGYFVMERNLKVDEPSEEQLERAKRKAEYEKKYGK